MENSGSYAWAITVFQNYFSTFVRDEPSDTLQFTVFLEVLKYAGKRRAFVIVSDDASYGLLMQYCHDNDFASVTIINIGSPDIEQRDIIQELLRIKSSTAHAVYLHCNSKIAHFILWIAKDYRLIDENMLWILSEKSLHDTPHLYTLPSFIYAIRTERFASEEEFDRRQLTDSLSVIQKTFGSMHEHEVREYLRQPSDCYSNSAWDKGQELHK